MADIFSMKKNLFIFLTEIEDLEAHDAKAILADCPAKVQAELNKLSVDDIDTAANLWSGLTDWAEVKPTVRVSRATANWLYEQFSSAEGSSIREWLPEMKPHLL